jgi:type III secretion protein D
MTQELAAELRIFTGIHAGARAALAPGDYLLGTDPACDFILCDEGVAGRHAELHIRDDGWTLHPLAECEAKTRDLKLRAGDGVAIGPILIAIEAPHAPWQIPVVPPALPPEPEVKALPIQPVDPFPSAPEVVLPPSTQRKSGRYVLPALAAAAVVLVGALWLLMPSDSSQPSAPSALPAEKSSEARIRAIIDSLDLASRTQLERSPDGRLVVRAEQLSGDEYENLAVALSRVNPRPELKVIDEQDLIREVHDVLRLHDATLTADYLGSGRFRINGRIAGEVERDALLQALAKDVPAARGFESAMLTPSHFATRFIDELLSSGAIAAKGEWQEDILVVSAKVPRTDWPRWESALLKIEERFGKLFPYKIRTVFEDTTAASLPFRILGVAGGETPFVVLSDQSKILLGGSARGWRLAEIDSDQIVFDGPRRAVVKR